MNVYGLDVEMVTIEPNNVKSAARVSLVAKNLQCVYDVFVRQQSRVIDYNTEVSGITKDMLINGHLIGNVRSEVLNILRNSIVVGHSIHHDFDALLIREEDLARINCIVRDTTEFSKFANVRRDKSTPSLKELVRKFLKSNIQQGAHSSVIDARAVVQLYNKFKVEWEREIVKSNLNRPKLYYSSNF
ncbi:uncharacterized protein LOC128682185 [Plodia interpunctella]|uniref:uncharacterized protein LOC128682185 n=1 Tax=Plodia interpunctella TaxID=58824 RepID=UPI0023688F64|nr:uncharacterized protein LOC128682185 [Plodia interpunctella]